MGANDWWRARMVPDFSQVPKDAKVLDDSKNLILYHMSEECFILTGPTSMRVGDHYGDPTCGVIDWNERWCVTGGDGLIVADFPTGGTFFDQQPKGRLREVQRFTNGIKIRPVLMTQVSDDTLRFAHDLTDERAVGIYDLNVVDLAIRKL